MYAIRSYYGNHVSLIILDKDTYLDIHINAGAGMSGKNKDEVQKKVEERNLTIAKKVAALILQKLHTKP